ncbi:hypothetical protein [Lacticaseibacillus absianus]|uniref:hypothetical protein n=1 Tax=Lacticaseibacillus absianus TaxID=2729623 RepID=UPI0015CD4B6B|nr:hypothetical protein [Lacticaseibacillus absianus]
MKKIMTIALIGLTTGLMLGCHQAAPATPSHRTRTVISSKQYTTTELQARFTKVTDAAVKPLDLASYQQADTKIKAAIKAGTATLTAVRLQLVSNQTEPALTKALIAYLETATKMLQALAAGEQATFNTQAKAFSTQCSRIGRQYFKGQLPESIVNYSQRVSK